MKLSQAIEGYFLSKELSFSQNTIRNYTYVFRYLVEFLGDVQIEAITGDDIRRFLVHLGKKRKMSKRSVHDAWIPLSSLWTWAEKELNLPHIVRGKVEQPTFTKRVIEPFTEDEIKRLVDAAEYSRPYVGRFGGSPSRAKRATATRDKAIILTLLDSGLRVTEFCALTIADYDQSRGRLRVQHGKGDKERYAVVGATAKKAIWKYLATRTDKAPSAPLFATKSGEHIRRDNLRNTLSAIGKAAGVAGVHPHKFRHTFAVNFLRNGGNVLLLKELLGHTSLTVVSMYVKLAEQDIDKAAKHSPADNMRI